MPIQTRLPVIRKIAKYTQLLDVYIDGGRRGGEPDIWNAESRVVWSKIVRLGHSESGSEGVS